MADRSFERYWLSPISSSWNADDSTWLHEDFLARGRYESSEGCYMDVRDGGEIWEFCRDAAKSLDGKAPFVISKYRALRA